MASEVFEKVQALHTRYIRSIDDDHIEAWPKLFTEKGVYRIITRENHSQGLPLAIMECRSRAMMEDRVTGLRRINVYEPQRYIHQTSALEIEPVSETRVKCRSNYLVGPHHGGRRNNSIFRWCVPGRCRSGSWQRIIEERVVVQDSRRVRYVGRDSALMWRMPRRDLLDAPLKSGTRQCVESFDTAR